MNNVITKNNDEVVNNLFDKIEGIIVSEEKKLFMRLIIL